MDSKLVGVACCLLVISLSLSVDGQLAGRLVTVLDAVVNNEIEVAYFITPPLDSSIMVAYTVYYGLNVSNPSEFDYTTVPSDMTIPGPTTPETPAIITGIPPATVVTVVVVANTSNETLASFPQSETTFGGGITAPGMVMTQRLNDNKAIRVTWIPVTANKIIHYEVQFRTVDQGTTTLISRDIGLSNGFLSFIINDLSEDSNYEVRVRAIVEAAPEDVGTIGMMAGPWSEWVESRVNDCCAVAGGAITLHNGILSTLFTSLLSIVVLCF